MILILALNDENENENKNLLDEDNISSEEFNSLIESSSDNKDFEFDDGINDLDLSGITEMELPKMTLKILQMLIVGPMLMIQ